MITGNTKDLKISEIVEELNDFLIDKQVPCDMYLYGKKDIAPTVFTLKEGYVSGTLLQYINQKTGFTFRWDMEDSRQPYSIGIRLSERKDATKLKQIVKSLKMIILMKNNLIVEGV